MLHKARFTAALSLLCALSLSGCASIMSGSRKSVTIQTNPPGAQVSVTDKKGQQVAALTTPCDVSLRRSRGFFMPAKYTATITKPGYRTELVQINPSLNPWYFGNILIGGLIGVVIIDPITGAVFTLTPSKIETQLTPTAKR